jgi:hypothetical protein
VKTDAQKLVAGGYEPATVHEKKMPISIDHSAFLEQTVLSDPEQANAVSDPRES